MDPEVLLDCTDRRVASWEIERVGRDSAFRERRPRKGRTPEGDFQAALAGEGTMSRQQEDPVVAFRQFRWD